MDREILRFTDKMFCPNCNITYPDFSTQNFSPNRAEGACENCLGIGEILQVDYNKIIDPYSPFLQAILPWRESNLGQNILKKLAQKYSMDPEKLRKELPEWFLNVVIQGDDELLRINLGEKYISMKYQGIESIIKDQYVKGMLTVDFQAMLNMKTCPSCFGSKLKKESLHAFLSLEIQKKSDLQTIKKLFKKELFIDQQGLPFASPEHPEILKVNIWDLQRAEISEIVAFLDYFKQSTRHPQNLLERILTPLMDRAKTIQEL